MTPAAWGGLTPWTGAAWILLLLLTAWSLRDAWARAEPVRWRCAWWALAVAAILCFRWPLLGIEHQLNPDESQLIAGAITLRHDPLFWRSVDGGTAGPFDYYPLLPAAWADGFASYAVARLIGLAAAVGTLFFVRRTIAPAAGDGVARLAVVPAVAFYALTTHPDFVHCSTEVMPVFLLAAAGYVTTAQGFAPSRGRLWLIGALAGAVPWAKPQAAPLAATLWAIAAGQEIFRGRPRAVIMLAAGALLPACACFAMVGLAGQTEHMIVPFLLRNLNYVREAPLPWGERLQLQWQNALNDGFLGLWFAGVLALGLLALSLWRQAAPPQRHGLLAAGLLLAAGVLSATLPSRPSTHHLLLLIPPLLWLGGMALAAAREQKKARLGVALFAVCAVLPLLGWRAWSGDGFTAFDRRDVSPSRRQLAALIRRFSHPDESLAVWGWRCSLYVEAGRRQATRQAQTEAQIYPNPLQSYFLRRYFEDFREANPPVFADAVGPGNFVFQDRARAHEAFPLLRAWVAARYTQVADVDGTRLYVRNDRLPAEERALPSSAGP